MPLVRISLLEGRPAAYRRAIADSVHRAIVETADVPALDWVQVIAEHTPESLIYDPTYLGIGRTDGVVFVQITLNASRSTEEKRALCGRVLELLARNVDVRPQNVLISLVEVPCGNRSFDNGEAQPASQLRNRGNSPSTNSCGGL